MIRIIIKIKDKSMLRLMRNNCNAISSFNVNQLQTNGNTSSTMFAITLDTTIIRSVNELKLYICGLVNIPMSQMINIDIFIKNKYFLNPNELVTIFRDNDVIYIRMKPLEVNTISNTSANDQQTLPSFKSTNSKLYNQLVGDESSQSSNSSSDTISSTSKSRPKIISSSLVTKTCHATNDFDVSRLWNYLNDKKSNDNVSLTSTRKDNIETSQAKPKKKKTRPKKRPKKKQTSHVLDWEDVYKYIVNITNDDIMKQQILLTSLLDNDIDVEAGTIMGIRFKLTSDLIQKDGFEFGIFYIGVFHSFSYEANDPLKRLMRFSFVIPGAAVLEELFSPKIFRFQLEDIDCLHMFSFKLKIYDLLQFLDKMKLPLVNNNEDESKDVCLTQEDDIFDLISSKREELDSIESSATEG